MPDVFYFDTGVGNTAVYTHMDGGLCHQCPTTGTQQQGKKKFFMRYYFFKVMIPSIRQNYEFLLNSERIIPVATPTLRDSVE